MGVGGPTESGKAVGKAAVAAQKKGPKDLKPADAKSKVDQVQAKKPGTEAPVQTFEPAKSPKKDFGKVVPQDTAMPEARPEGQNAAAVQAKQKKPVAKPTEKPVAKPVEKPLAGKAASPAKPTDAAVVEKKPLGALISKEMAALILRDTGAIKNGGLTDEQQKWVGKKLAEMNLSGLDVAALAAVNANLEVQARKDVPIDPVYEFKFDTKKGVVTRELDPSRIQPGVDVAMIAGRKVVPSSSPDVSIGREMTSYQMASGPGHCTVDWDRVTTYTDGTACNSLAGYKMRLVNVDTGVEYNVDVGNVAHLRVTGMEPGTYVIRGKAYTSEGTESAWTPNAALFTVSGN